MAYYFVAVSSLFVAFLYGFRDIDSVHGGIDTKAYREIFLSLDISDASTFFNQRVEKGYVLIMWIIKSLGLNFSHFMMVFYILLCLFFYKISLFLTRSWTLVFSVLMLSVIFLESFNISRMSLATLVFFYAFINLTLGKKIKSFAYILFAISLQITFVWGGLVVLYYLFINKVSRQYRLFIHIGLFLLSFLAVQIFKDALSYIGYSYYLDVQDADIKPSYLNYIFIMILLLVNGLFLKDKINNAISKSIMTILPSMMFIIPFYSALPIAYRFNYIYFPMIAFIIPDIYMASKKIKIAMPIRIGIATIPIVYVLLKVNSYYNGDIEYLLNWKVTF
ncbi:EpsG family protein [Aeromonas rivipollensis]|uniref:EpsG family protein n=1 Tax=Aeromonas rivipollensis TaxID=948519 RepID=UPI003D209B18